MYYERNYHPFQTKPVKNREEQDIPNSSRSIEPKSSNQKKVRLPVLNLDKSRKTGETSKTPERTAKVPNIKHFRNFSEDLDKKIAKAIANPLETMRFNFSVELS